MSGLRRNGAVNAARLELADDVWAEVRAELDRAWTKFPRISSSAHEAYAVLQEEVEELWDEVKANNRQCQRAEAVQAAAMAVRFIVDLFFAAPAEVDRT